MDTKTARMLVRYMAWANKLQFDAVRALPGDEATKPRVSLEKSILHTLQHIYKIGTMWQGHLEGRQHSHTTRRALEDIPLEEMWRLQEEIDQYFIAWADAQTEVSWLEKVNFTLVGGNRGTMTRSEILLHLVLHAGYHHGYLCDMFYHVPFPIAITDLPVFLRTVPETWANA